MKTAHLSLSSASPCHVHCAVYFCKHSYLCWSHLRYEESVILPPMVDNNWLQGNTSASSNHPLNCLSLQSPPAQSYFTFTYLYLMPFAKLENVWSWRKILPVSRSLNWALCALPPGCQQAEHLTDLYNFCFLFPFLTLAECRE